MEIDVCTLMAKCHQLCASWFSLLPTNNCHIVCLLLLERRLFWRCTWGDAAYRRYTVFKLWNSSLIQYKKNKTKKRSKYDEIQTDRFRRFAWSFCFHNFDIYLAQDKCHIEHFPLHLINEEVTKQDSDEVNSDFKQGIYVGNKRKAHYLLSKRCCNDMSRSRIT